MRRYHVKDGAVQWLFHATPGHSAVLVCLREPVLSVFKDEDESVIIFLAVLS